MRICHVIESSSGGSARAALALARGQAAAGDEVCFVYSPLRADDRFEADKRAIAGVRFCALAMQRSVGMRDLFAAWELSHLLRKMGPFDVLHAHSSKAGALARIAGLFFPQTIKIYTPHAFVTMAPGVSRFYGLIERGLGYLGSAVIAVSNTEREHAVRDLGMSADKVVVIPNGVTLRETVGRGEARDRMGFGEAELVLGFAGRLTDQKNPQRLLAAFVHAARSRPELRLAIIGNGPLLEAVAESSQDSGLNGKIRVWTEHEARLFIPGFDALVCSSDYEGFPLVFLEALAAGVPIVTTPVGGAQESAIPGKTGFIAEDFEPESLARSFLAFAREEPAQRAAMSQAAREQAQAFSEERMVAAVRDLYLSSLAKGRRK